jgi:hypothetical protein
MLNNKRSRRDFTKIQLNWFRTSLLVLMLTLVPLSFSAAQNPTTTPNAEIIHLQGEINRLRDKIEAVARHLNRQSSPFELAAE